MFKKNWFRVLVTITVGLFILTLIYSEFENLVAEKNKKNLNYIL
jgi:hypothetical protein